jgi:hypothetical protein
MSDVNLFSNTPFFCQKNLSTSEVLSLPVINMNLGLDTNGDPNNFGKCGDPNHGSLIVKNLIHKQIRCGGKPIDITFMEDMFPMSNPTNSTTKEWQNHYICDPDWNVYVAASVEGTAPGQPAWAQLLKSNHGENGAYSLPQLGYSFFDKDNQVQYQITDIDNSIPWAHRFEVTPLDEDVTVELRPNKAYLIAPARLVGGCNGTQITNSLTSIGYTQVNHALRVRRDWKLCVDLLTGYKDKFQFTIVYDSQGRPMDAWDVKEAQDMREGIRAALNMSAFIGTPITNPSLISGVGATVDPNHTGFYGLVPSLRYGGGNVYDYRSDLGFDLEADGEPIFLYQDSRKRTKKFMVMHGQKFAFSLVDRQNKMVARTQVGATVWEAFKRLGSLTETPYETEMAKLGLRHYSYMGFDLDFKKMDSWSDYRYIGSDYFNDLAIFMPQDGINNADGSPLNPVEFYTYGNGQWTGNYEEHYIDYRNQVGGENAIGGWAAQSLGMAVHCPNQWVLANPVKAA